MPETLDFDQLHALLSTVFRLRDREEGLVIMVDLPDARVPDTPAWRERREMARQWFDSLVAHAPELPFASLIFCTYPNVGSNNNDLPEQATAVRGLEEGSGHAGGEIVPFGRILAASSVVLAPTQLSATAPLKVLAREHRFRGATLPDFRRSMIPALALDFERVDARVREFKARMDRADGVVVRLATDGGRFESFFDLRFRSGHASGGLMREPGTVGNLPSGEAYIVPYEGEREGEPSRTAGELPVQFDDEIVVYRLEGNRAVEVLGGGPQADEERRRLDAEPAYGNMAEVGIGVLGEWGVEAVGSTLLDEKLGLHIAFGRSDHFGGATSPASFRDRANVVHIDRVYVPSVQPAIAVAEVTFVYPDDERETVMRAGAFVV